MSRLSLLSIGAVLGLALACNSSSPTSPASPVSPNTGLSAAERSATAQQLAQALGNAFGNLNASSVAGKREALRADALVNTSFFGRANCPAGGRIEVSGNISGSIDNNGSGVLLIGGQETITDWRCIQGRVYNGDPYISLAGTFSFLNGAPATQQHVLLGGGFKWGNAANETCAINLTINLRTTGSGGNVSGTLCGGSVNLNF